MDQEEASFRLKIAEGFLAESKQDVELKRWRSAVDNAQLSVENAAKAILGLVAPVGKTHNPAFPLRQALDSNLFPQQFKPDIEQIIELTEKLGFDVHVQTDYGDELGGLTPWELFDQEDAEEAVESAIKAVQLAQTLIDELLA
jgi:HEPN domain-containing protein